MLREQGLAGLRKQWQQAIADDSEGLDPDQVFARLESNYEGLPNGQVMRLRFPAHRTVPESQAGFSASSQISVPCVSFNRNIPKMNETAATPIG